LHNHTKEKREETSLELLFANLYIVPCLHICSLKVKIFLSPLMIKLNLKPSVKPEDHFIILFFGSHYLLCAGTKVYLKLCDTSDLETQLA